MNTVISITNFTLFKLTYSYVYIKGDRRHAPAAFAAAVSFLFQLTV